MKTALPHPDVPSGGRVAGVARAIDRFWFAPADPTILGLIRLFTGFLTLYVHLAYCLDLQEFFGKDAWLSLESANLQRKGTPWMAPSSDWGPTPASLTLPQDQESRAAVVDYLAGLANGPAQERDQFVDYFLGRLPQEPDWGANVPPAFLLNIQDVDPWGKQRTTTFIRQLPKDPNQRAYIFDYMKEWGIDPRQTDHQGYYSFSIWFHVYDPVWMIVTQSLIVVITLLFAIGFCTRITSVLTWLAAVSYIQRSPVSLFGADTMMNILLLYLMIGPSGAALSVDRLIGRWLARRKAKREGRPELDFPPPQPTVSANFALRLMQVHFCFIYLAAGTSKLLGGNWWNGQAIYYTMANYEFAPMNYAYYMANLRFLCRHRWLWEIFMEGGSYFTLALEISLPFLVWNRRLRPFMVAGSMLLHIMIGLTMGLVVFSFLMATFVMSFIPGEAVQRLLARFRRFRPAPAPAIAEEEDLDTLPARKEKVAAGGTHIKAKD